MVRQANINDIDKINDMFLNVVLWMKENKLKQWRFRDLDWGKIPFNITDFYICFDPKSTAVGFLILSPLDINNIWNEWEFSNSLYVYKLAVKREYAKQGFSTELLNFSKDFAKQKNYSNLCLYCQTKRLKLRDFYERNGFVFAGQHTIKGETDTSSFYVCKIN